MLQRSHPLRGALDLFGARPDRGRSARTDACEGDPAARGQIVDALRKRNYRILEAENREQAIHLAQQFSLGAILLGISQQRREGLQTLRALRDVYGFSGGVWRLPVSRRK